jgi:hypothetical protein
LYTNNSLTLTGNVVVAGGTPLGSLTISGGGYTGVAWLSGAAPGQYSLTIPAGSLNAGTDVLSVTYNGSSFYSPASTSTTVTVTQFVKLTPSLTATPASNAIDTGQSLNVNVAVAGGGGQATGTLTLTSGSFNSGMLPISGGSVTVVVPANTFSAGTATLNVSYSGDPTYLPASGTATITVGTSTYTIAASTPATVSPGASAYSTITFTTTNGYNGTITSSCTLTAQPSDAIDLPVCTVQGSATLVLQPGVQNAYSSAVVTTIAATANLAKPALPGSDRKSTGIGGIALALAILLWIPARSRRWKSMLGVLVLLAAFGGLGACGGGSGSGGGGGGGDTGTTPGTYTFTVTGTGNPAETPAPTTTFTVTVT